MTLLPLLLTNPEGFAMTAASLGKVYAGMSAVQVVGSQPLALLTDSIGKRPVIVAGSALVGGSILALTQCETLETAAAALGMWAVGGVFLSTAPIAYVSDLVEEVRKRVEKRQSAWRMSTAGLAFARPLRSSADPPSFVLRSPSAPPPSRSPRPLEREGTGDRSPPDHGRRWPASRCHLHGRARGLEQHRGGDGLLRGVLAHGDYVVRHEGGVPRQALGRQIN